MKGFAKTSGISHQLKTIIWNASYLLTSNVLVRFVGAAVSVLVARYLGPRDYGALAVGLALASVAGYFTDLGLTHTLIREGTKPGAVYGRLLAGALKLRIILAAVTTLVLVPGICFLYSDPALGNVVLAVVIPTIWGGALQGAGIAYFQMVQQMQYIALIRVVSGLTTAAALGVGILLGWPLFAIALSYGVSSLIGAIVSVALLFHNVQEGIGGWDSGLLAGLGSFTLGGLAVMLLPQLGPLVLERVADLQQVGYFSAAFRLPALLYQLPGTLAAAFYPQLFYYGTRSLARHLELNIVELKLMGAIGVGMALPITLYPGLILRLLFGAEWTDSSAEASLAILAWMVVLQSINYPLADALTTRGMQPRRTAVLSVGLLVGLVSYSAFGLRWGAIGAAMAAVGVECVLGVGFIVSNPHGMLLARKGLEIPIAMTIVGLAVGITTRELIEVEWLGLACTMALMVVTLLLMPDVRASIRSVATEKHGIDREASQDRGS